MKIYVYMEKYQVSDYLQTDKISTFTVASIYTLIFPVTLVFWDKGVLSPEVETKATTVFDHFK